MSNYNPILEVFSPPETEKEIYFRTAGDGFILEEYGREQELDPADSFRGIAAKEKVEDRDINGLIEVMTMFRTVLYRFDTSKITEKELIDTLKECEQEIGEVEEIEFETRIVELPLAFEDGATKKAVEKYEKGVREDAPNIIDGYNLKYIAKCNGISVEEIKEKITGTGWFNVSCGFWPGHAFLFPLDPRCALTVPKYNPPRTWTPARAVGIGGPHLAIYPIESAGGYQLVGRTIPILQFSQVHPEFEESPVILQPKDIIEFTPAEEGEVEEITRKVEEGTGYDYKKKLEKFSVKEYFNFREEVKDKVEEFRKKQVKGTMETPVP